MDAYIIAALIGAVPTGALAIATIRNGRRVGAVHQEVKTNSGYRAGEYIEQISNEQKTVALALLGADARQRVMDQALRDHIATDETATSRIEGMLAARTPMFDELQGTMEKTKEILARHMSSDEVQFAASAEALVKGQDELLKRLAAIEAATSRGQSAPLIDGS